MFPNVAVFRVAQSDILLVASGDQLDLMPAALKRMFSRPLVRADLERLGIRSREELVALWVADGNGLSAAVGEGPFNTDDNGLIEFGSPWYVLRDTREANLAHRTLQFLVGARSGAKKRLLASNLPVLARWLTTGK